MKTSHRSAKLDALIEKKVRIIFDDKKVVEGLLFFNPCCKAPRYLKSQHYYVIQDNGQYYGFRKTHVRYCDPI